MLCGVLFFFFSSRRRHTRLQGDWSSDVCSSDLCRRAEPGIHAGRLDPQGQALRRIAAARANLPAGLYRERGRSEEHTSELQSPCNLVCRLLLEKKKQKNTKRSVET